MKTQKYKIQILMPLLMTGAITLTGCFQSVSSRKGTVKSGSLKLKAVEYCAADAIFNTTTPACACAPGMGILDRPGYSGTYICGVPGAFVGPSGSITSGVAVAPPPEQQSWVSVMSGKVGTKTAALTCPDGSLKKPPNYECPVAPPAGLTMDSDLRQGICRVKIYSEGQQLLSMTDLPVSPFTPTEINAAIAQIDNTGGSNAANFSGVGPAENVGFLRWNKRGSPAETPKNSQLPNMFLRKINLGGIQGSGNRVYVELQSIDPSVSCGFDFGSYDRTLFKGVQWRIGKGPIFQTTGALATALGLVSVEPNIQAPTSWSSHYTLTMPLCGNPDGGESCSPPMGYPAAIGTAWGNMFENFTANATGHVSVNRLPGKTQKNRFDVIAGGEMRLSFLEFRVWGFHSSQIFSPLNTSAPRGSRCSTLPFSGLVSEEIRVSMCRYADWYWDVVNPVAR